jgi:endonuclease YncB( thermonuclease family)
LRERTGEDRVRAGGTWKRRSLALGVAGLAAPLALLLSLAADAQQPQRPREAPPETCELQGGPTQAVVRVIDAETVLLDDNSEVRLIGALAPRSPDMSPGVPIWPPEADAEAALRDLLLGKSVELAYAERRVDRYGRLLAHLFLNRGSERIWVQGALLSGGHARAYGLPGSFACMRELLAHEHVARQAHAGLWANATYTPQRAYRPRALLRLRNTYQIVAGRVARVVSTKSRTYLNFGKDWRSDFTAGVGAGLLRANPEWAKSLAALEGREIEVRGWIEYRNGPFIDVEDTSQIAIVEDRSQPPALLPGAPLLSSERGAAPHKRKRPAKGPGAVDL